MNINPLIEAALADIGCPVDPIKHDGTENTYIVYYTLTERGALYGDDEEIEVETFATVTVYSKGNFKTLVAAAKQRLKQAGFTITSTGPESFESDTGYYQLPIEICIEE